MHPITSLVASTGLCWTMIMVASLARSRAWTWPGMKVAFGNRDDVPTPSPFNGRADRAAINMVENLAMFAALLLAASWARVPEAELRLPCALFVWSRVVYVPLYWAGVPYLRTAMWSVSVAGMGWIGYLAAGRL